MDIARITIKSRSGYCAMESVYEDKLTLTPNSISYEYTPYIETDSHTKQKWAYHTNSPLFEAAFQVVAEKAPEIINLQNVVQCLDIGDIEFIITYTDKHRARRTYWCDGSAFSDFFRLIQPMIPQTEMLPTFMEDETEEEE